MVGTAPPVLWLVQTNLGEPATPAAIRAACARNGLAFHGFERVPFSDALPDVDHDGPVIAYGATRFIKAAVDARRWTPGAFFDESTFTVSACLRHWQEWMINRDAAVLRLDAIGDLPYGDTDEIFVRPDGDLKAFAGEVTTFGALKRWAAALGDTDFTLDGSLPVAVARPKPIDAEWRVFAADGPRIIAATRYRLDGRVAPEAGAPPEVLAFAEVRLRDWMPRRWSRSMSQRRRTASASSNCRTSTPPATTRRTSRRSWSRAARSPRATGNGGLRPVDRAPCARAVRSPSRNPLPPAPSSPAAPSPCHYRRPPPPSHPLASVLLNLVKKRTAG